MASNLIPPTSRQDVIDRDGDCCYECGRPGKFTYHHCIPQSVYDLADKDKAWNLIKLCPDCHREVEANPHKRSRYVELAMLRKPGKKDESEDMMALQKKVIRLEQALKGLSGKVGKWESDIAAGRLPGQDAKKE